MEKQKHTPKNTQTKENKQTNKKSIAIKTKTKFVINVLDCKDSKKEKVKKGKERALPF